MTAYQVYEQSVKPLSVAEKLILVRLIIDEVVPLNQPETRAGNELLAVPIDDMFVNSMPEDEKES